MAEFLSLPPSLKAIQGRQFCLGMTGKLKLMEGGADVNVPPQGSHLFPPPVHFLHEEGIFCHSVVSVKDKGIWLMRGR